MFTQIIVGGVCIHEYDADVYVFVLLWLDRMFYFIISKDNKRTNYNKLFCFILDNSA